MRSVYLRGRNLEQGMRTFPLQIGKAWWMPLVVNVVSQRMMSLSESCTILMKGLMHKKQTV